MITGLNHNIMHNGHLYHIQTEDSGRRNPHVISHLFLDGVILATEKNSYAESVGLPEAEFTEAVKKIINKSHRMMINKLVTGGYDHLAQSAAIKEQEAVRKNAEEDEAMVDMPTEAAIELTPAESIELTPPEQPAAPAQPEVPANNVDTDSMFEAQEAELNLYMLLGQRPRDIQRSAPVSMRQTIMRMLGVQPE